MVFDDRNGVIPVLDEVFFSENEIVSIKTRELVVRSHSNRIHGTGFLAHPTKHTPEHVDIKFFGVFFHAGVRVFGRRDMDALCWTIRRAQHARCTTNIAVFFDR